jgi:hypothetical protein
MASSKNTSKSQNGTQTAEAPAEPKSAKPSRDDLFLLLATRREAVAKAEAEVKKVEDHFAERLEPFLGMTYRDPETKAIMKVTKGKYGYVLRNMESEQLRAARAELGD